MSSTKKITETVIRNLWKRNDFARKLAKAFDDDSLYLTKEDFKCYKDSFKSSIWRLKITTKEKGASRYIILKIFKSLSNERPESLIELNMYRSGRKILQEFMPVIYHIQDDVLGDDAWVFMEYIERLESQVDYSPRHFDEIIPILAKLHAQTYQHRFHRSRALFSGWLPVYQSEDLAIKRNRVNAQTLHYLGKSMSRPDLKAMISPFYERFETILHKGPHYFPELTEAGICIVHSDLQALNIGCNNVHEHHWQIKFIDWEGARADPCWFDLVSLVGVFLSYREDWRRHESSIIRHCSRLYAKEMQKQGIEFRLHPEKLYKMAVLQLILEKNLYLQLFWEQEGIKKAVLLPGFIEKINIWGKELGLYA